MNIEQPNDEQVIEVDVNAAEQKIAEEFATADTQPEEMPAALREVDPAKMAALRDKVKKFAASKAKTESGSEAPAEKPEEGPVTDGKLVDWTEYDLDYTVRHLYKDAQVRMTPQGAKWVAFVDEFHSETKNFGNHGQKRNKGAGDPINLGEYLNDMLNGVEGWRLVSVLPAGTGQAGILLQRSLPVVLPDPKKLKKETEVEAPSDPELQKVEDAALAFAAEEGLTPPDIEQPIEPEQPVDQPVETVVEEGDAQ